MCVSKLLATAVGFLVFHFPSLIDNSMLERLKIFVLHSVTDPTQPLYANGSNDPLTEKGLESGNAAFSVCSCLLEMSR